MIQEQTLTEPAPSAIIQDGWAKYLNASLNPNTQKELGNSPELSVIDEFLFGLMMWCLVLLLVSGAAVFGMAVTQSIDSVFFMPAVVAMIASFVIGLLSLFGYLRSGSLEEDRFVEWRAHKDRVIEREVDAGNMLAVVEDDEIKILQKIEDLRIQVRDHLFRLGREETDEGRQELATAVYLLKELIEAPVPNPDHADMADFPDSNDSNIRELVGKYTEDKIKRDSALSSAKIGLKVLKYKEVKLRAELEFKKEGK